MFSSLLGGKPILIF